MAHDRRGLAARAARAAVKHAVMAAATGGASLKGLAIRVGLAAAAVVVVIVAIVAMALLGAGSSAAQPTAGTLGCTPSATGQQQPGLMERLALYEQAAARFHLDEYGVWVLAGIHSVETGFSTNVQRSSAGALGPMQFMPASWAQGSPTDPPGGQLITPPTADTNDGYATDGDGDGRADINSEPDAIHAAARYLEAAGAPADYRRAIFAYNHSNSYVDQVLDAAERFRGPCTVVVATGPVNATIRPGMTPKQIIDEIVLPIAAQNGIQRSVAENDAANARHGPTKNGGRSDHQGPPEVAWAADMGNGPSPTPEMDRLATVLADTFGIPRLDLTATGKGGSAQFSSATKDGYRFQLIYRSYTGGNHDNHVHLGVGLASAP